MGLESLFLFTLLGGLAAGAYVFETCFQRTRKGERPWLVPLVVVVLFAIGMIAAATHVHSLSRAFASIGAGTVNFGSGMVKEVLLAGIFFILALIDLIITFVKKDSPFSLRVIGAIAAVLVIVLMGTAYIDVYGNVVWSNAPATVLSFVAGALAMGLGLCAAFGSADIAEKPVMYTLVAVDVVLAVGLALENRRFLRRGLEPGHADCGPGHRSDCIRNPGVRLRKVQQQENARNRRVRPAGDWRCHCPLRFLRDLRNVGKQKGGTNSEYEQHFPSWFLGCFCCCYGWRRGSGCDRLLCGIQP